MCSKTDVSLCLSLSLSVSTSLSLYLSTSLSLYLSTSLSLFFVFLSVSLRLSLISPLRPGLQRDAVDREEPAAREGPRLGTGDGRPTAEVQPRTDQGEQSPEDAGTFCCVCGVWCVVCEELTKENSRLKMQALS